MHPGEILDPKFQSPFTVIHYGEKNRPAAPSFRSLLLLTKGEQNSLKDRRPRIPEHMDCSRIAVVYGLIQIVPTPAPYSRSMLRFPVTCSLLPTPYCSLPLMRH